MRVNEVDIGDMELSQDQIDAIQPGLVPYSYSNSTGSRKRNARNFIGKVGWNHAWINGVIPYTIDASLKTPANAEIREDIRASIQEYERTTCLRFEDITYDKSRQGRRDSYIIFQLDPNACNSPVGRRLAALYPGVQGSGMGGVQKINLSPKIKKFYYGQVYYKKCNSGVPAVLHEIGHAIGFEHEHMRWDRDEYIKINWQNTDENPQTSVNLGKMEKKYFTDYGVPYDFFSIMHYAPTMASNGNGNGVVFQARKRYLKYQSSMGKSKHLSFGDRKLVNLMYKCKRRTPGCTRKCEHEGFVDQNCECMCPKDDGKNTKRCGDQGVTGVTEPPTAPPPPTTPAPPPMPLGKYRCDDKCPLIQGLNVQLCALYKMQCTCTPSAGGRLSLRCNGTG